jgi:hypothetical protein
MNHDYSKTGSESQVTVERHRGRNSSIESLMGLAPPEFDSHEFIDELKIALSPTLTVKEDVLHGKGAIDPLLWFGLAFAFASTTIATSILSKIGEDIYNHFKGALLAKIDKKDQKKIKKLREVLEERDTMSPEERLKALSIYSKYLIEFSLTIRVNNIFTIHGHASADSYDTLIQSLKSLASIIDQVGKEEEQNPQKIHFSYEYNISTRKWIPAKHSLFTEGSQSSTLSNKQLPTEP